MPSQTPLKLTPTSGTTGELREFAAGDFLPLSAGGTGVAAGTTADVRAALGLGSAAVAPILGTVSQSGGVPTGAIIQRGSNSNGGFVRFADGTQICTVSVAPTLTAATSAVQSAYVWTFPAAFVGYPRGTWATRNFGGEELITWLRVNSATNASFSLKNTGAAINAAYDVEAYAIGRWF